MAKTIKAAFDFTRSKSDAVKFLKDGDHKGLRDLLQQAQENLYIVTDCSAKAMPLNTKAGKLAIENAAQSFIGTKLVVRSTVKERGWTDKQIDSLYGQESANATNPYYKSAAPMRLYSLQRVQLLEAQSGHGDAIQKRDADRKAKAAAKQEAAEKKVKAFKSAIPVLWANWANHFKSKNQAIAAAIHIINKIAKTVDRDDRSTIYDLKDEALEYLYSEGCLVQTAISRTEEYGYYECRNSRNLYVQWFNADGFAVCFHSYNRLGNPVVNLNQDDAIYGEPLSVAERRLFIKTFGSTEDVKSLTVFDVCEVLEWAIENEINFTGFGNGLAEIGLPEPVPSHSIPIDLTHILKRQILIELESKSKSANQEKIKKSCELAVKHIARHAWENQVKEKKFVKKAVSRALIHFGLNSLNQKDHGLLAQLVTEEFSRIGKKKQKPLPECDVRSVVIAAMGIQAEPVTVEEIDELYATRTACHPLAKTPVAFGVGDRCILRKDGHDHNGQTCEVIQSLSPAWIKLRFRDGYESIVSQWNLQKTTNSTQAVTA